MAKMTGHTNDSFTNDGYTNDSYYSSKVTHPSAECVRSHCRFLYSSLSTSSRSLNVIAAGTTTAAAVAAAAALSA
jgi:hypothetical protein